ncbi:hypothetical protein [Treponema pectinovorum]|uniref:hypothetical protein n=1 Tax=Treponema pectinovorum TaxID=164 RepID=UPI0011CC8C3E|nr:hypothetical protein [Treponema pectinovorum]
MLKNKMKDSKKKSHSKRIIKISQFSIFRKLPTLLSLTRRGFFFFLFLLIAQLFLFFSGNVQNFLDENLKLILFLSSCTAIGMAFFALAATIECIYYIVATKKLFFYVHLVIFIVFFVLALAISLATNFVEVLTEGI